MPQALTLDLSDDDRRQLENARDHHGKPYVRERATALLKIADGQSGRKVALEGLLKKRKPDKRLRLVSSLQRERGGTPPN